MSAPSDRAELELLRATDAEQLQMLLNQATTIRSQIAEIETLQAENAELREALATCRANFSHEVADASRYRWLRNNWDRAGRFLNPADLNACVDWHIAALATSRSDSDTPK
jgi:hypothetical protein